MELKEWRKKVDEALVERIDEQVKAFREKQKVDLQKLVELSEQLEKINGELKETQAIRETEIKTFLPDPKITGECDRKIWRKEKAIRELQKQIDVIFAKLTEIPDPVMESVLVVKLLS